MRILLVEDDPLLGDGMQAGLKQAGFGVDWVRDGAAAELAVKTGTYAGMVLDLGLPRLEDIARRAPDNLSPIDVADTPAEVAPLVDNAVRYSPASSVVSVRLDSRPVRLTVLDSGAGVPPEERASLGRRFHRVLGTGESGSGLGLSIVKRIAELHDARVEFGKGEQGRGLRVSVVFTGPAR